jgi:dienelactone hydrolase
LVMRFKGLVLAGILLLLLSNDSFSQVQTARNISMVPNSGGFYEYLPQGYNTGTLNYPLIVFIHGLGEVGNGTSQLPLVLNNAIPKLINQGTFPTSFTVNGQTFRFIVISPQFLGWPVPTDIEGVLDYLVQHYRVDQTRIYITGLSMGGGATWDYGGGSSVYANRLAAIVPVCGASFPEPVRCRVITNANLPVWATHNSGDPTVPVSYTNDYIANINMAPSPTPLAKKSIFPVSGHDAWSKTYDPNWKEDGVMNIYQWMLQYTRSTAGPNPNQPPVSNAGVNQTIDLRTSSVTLNGSGTDADGTIASYTWTQINGTAASITSPSSASTTITGLTTIGTRLFALRVTDDKGASGISYVSVTVNPAPKVIPGRIEAENWDAKLGPQYAITTNDAAGGGQHVIGISNGSWMDYNVNVVTTGVYTVSFRVATTQNVSQYQLKSGNTILATFNVPNTGGWSNWVTASVTASLTSGDQTFRILSTNNESSNLNWIDFALTTGGPTNQPPSANAGANQIIILPASTAALTGSGTDPDGTIASYAWTQVSGTAATIANPSSASTGISGLTTAGVRVFRLTVTDNLGATATSNVTITVNTASNIKTIPGRIEAENWDAKSGYQYAVSTNDAGGGQQVVGISNGSWMDYNVNVTTTGTYTVSFRVATTQLLAQLQLKSGNTILATANIPNTGGWDVWTTITISNISLTAGPQTLRILSVNNETCNLNWLDFALTTGGPTNQPPTANAGANQTITLPASTASLTGSGTDPDGTIASYAWTQVSGTAATIANPSSASTGISGLTTAGARVFRLTVTDNLGAIAISDETMTVTATSNIKTIPGRIEAENWDAKSGPQYAISTNDAGGGQQVIGISNGSWMDYNVNVTTAGTYTVDFRVATTQVNAQFQIKSGNTVLETINIPYTGGWNTWLSGSITITLAAGNQTLRILSTNNESCNFNWMDFTLSNQAARTVSTSTTAAVNTQNTLPAEPIATSSITIFPNPVQDYFVLRSNNIYEGAMRIQIIDANGRIRKEIQSAKNKGRGEIYLSANGIAPGSYIIRVQMGAWTKSIKMVKQ